MNRPRIVEAKTWKSANAAERSTLAIAKSFADDSVELATKGSNGEPVERALWWTVSTETRDRDNDVITVSGWDLKSFKKNPVIPWGHNYSEPPIGMALETVVDTEKKRLRMLKQFAPAEVHPFAAMIFELAKQKYIRAASVGFIPREFEPDPEQKDDEPAWRRGYVHTKKELLESSIVTVPSNPTALQEARAVHGIDLTPYVEFAEKILDGERGPGLWVPRKSVEELIAIVRPHKPTVIVEERTHAGPHAPATDPAPVPPVADERQTPATETPPPVPGAVSTPSLEERMAALETTHSDLRAALDGVTKAINDLKSAVEAKSTTPAPTEPSVTGEAIIEIADEPAADDLYVLSVDEERDAEPDDTRDLLEIDESIFQRTVTEVLGPR